MKPKILLSGRFVLVVLTVCLSVVLVSWDYNQSPGQYEQSVNDTTPKNNREKKVRDLDDALDELDRIDFKADFEKAMKEAAKALKEFDGAKIKLEIDKALMEIDFEKIKKDVQESLAKVDFNKIKAEIADAMAEVDMVKIQKEVKESLAKVDWEEMKDEIAKVKNIDMKKMEADMKKLSVEMKELGPKMEKEMQKAKVEIEKAKVTLKEYKGFVDGLEKDGLINRKEGYTLQHKDGELFINGKKATDQTYSKYRSFLDKHKKFNIDKNDDDFDLDID